MRTLEELKNDRDNGRKLTKKEQARLEFAEEKKLHHPVLVKIYAYADEIKKKEPERAKEILELLKEAEELLK